MKYLNLLRDKLLSIYTTIGWRDLVVVLLLNTLGAVLNALHYLIADGADFSAFYASITEYIKVYNLLGFALMFSYLLLSPGPDAKLGFLRVMSIGGLAFAISLPVSFLMFGWSGKAVPPLLAASTYLLGNLLLAAWAIFVIIYVKRRESQIQFQNLRNQIAQTTEQRDKAELELHLLQAQLEPHFFFNTLANLHNLIDIDGERAKHLLEELTRYLRSTIPQFRQRFIKLSEELEIVRRYLNIQKIRFGDKLNFQIDSDDNLATCPVLPMSVLSLVENAIKHGIEKTRRGGTIRIVATQQGQSMLLTVSDDADLLQDEPQGTGLSNLIARLEKAYDGRARFSMSCQSPLTVATLELPLHG
ncbi:sensor histidine kinase [Bowmanella yangjiangensis]|uniref:Histidine kinase n=1 Tax=Bowmanella yangjiangensis TaxID=2811230 RepID=A0ABS3CVQ7_9ALTE|nr:histidine kinase [Bowmanella yangjiangensis]MBN7820496.1 histidine kinase [Bowmanella yangjiangensis]